MNLFSRLGRTLRRALCLAILALSSASIAQSPASLTYSISLLSPEQHLVEVQIFLPEGTAQSELQLPVWNALYQVRDFAQYVNWVRAKDRSGHPLAVRELNHSRWQIKARSVERSWSIKCMSTRPDPSTRS